MVSEPGRGPDTREEGLAGTGCGFTRASPRATPGSGTRVPMAQLGPRSLGHRVALGRPAVRTSGVLSGPCVATLPPAPEPSLDSSAPAAPRLPRIVRGPLEGLGRIPASGATLAKRRTPGSRMFLTSLMRKQIGFVMP